MENISAATEKERARVLVVSGHTDFPGSDGGGSWEIATALARRNDVILALPERSELSHREFAVVYYNRRNLSLIARDSDAVVCGGEVVRDYPFLREKGRLAPAAPSLTDGFLERLTTDAAVGPGSYHVWTPPEEPDRYGLKHYARKFRYYMRTGGARYTASRAAAALGRRLKRRG